MDEAKVFTTFAMQDSGGVALGVEIDGRRAGAGVPVACLAEPAERQQTVEGFLGDWRSVGGGCASPSVPPPTT